MIASRRPIAAVVLATAALSPVALAHAASLPTIDVWSGKSTKKHDGMFMSNVRGTKTVQMQITVGCLATDGTKTPTSFSATAKLSGGKVKITNKRAAESGGDATLTVSATLPKTRAATGKVSWRQAATDTLKACAGSDTFTLKHQISHGG
jgi:hypothetical protein